MTSGTRGLSQGAEAGPAIVGFQGDREKRAQLAVEVGEARLGSGDDTGGDVGERLKVVREQAQGSGLAGAGIAGDEGEAALAHQGLHAPAEVFEWGWSPEGLDRDVGREGIPLEPVEGMQVAHQRSSWCGM